MLTNVIILHKAIYLKYNMTFKIIKISACKRQKSQRLFKVHYRTARKTRWVIITQIPPTLLANFYTLKFQKKKCKEKKGSKKVLFEGETNGVEHQ
jgi:hypothetical protein